MSESREALVGRFQELYLNGTIDGVAFVAADSTRCESCGRFDDQVYTPSTLPEIPVAECTRASGCRCRYEANFTVYE
ncbi:MAG: hypothetical protein QOH61_1435 [Chloroflexota bacterium]|jgi:hypothetical protein|nr:hypothetical protein [Chloroflexota bacterium]